MRSGNEKWWVRFFKGMTLGLGMIPGVSAGTMALVFDFYDVLINGIANLRKEFKKSFVTLFPMGVGAVISILAIAIFVQYGYKAAPFAITCLFAGFILGTTPIIKSQIDMSKINYKSWILFIVSILFVVAIGVFSCVSELFWHMDMTAGFEEGLWWIYPVTLFAGFVSAVTCILPGISGAMILFIFGMYNPIMGFFIGDNSMLHDTSRIPVGLGITACLLVGVFIGFVACSKGMKYLLANHHQGTMICIMGFIVGSIVAMFLNQEMVAYSEEASAFVWVYQTTPTWEWIVGPIIFVAVAAIVMFISIKHVKRQASLTEETDSRNTENE